MSPPLHAEVQGPEEAPALVCFHGGIGTGRYHWSRQVDALAERFRVHLPDLPGHGGSPLPEGATYDRALLSGAVADYLDHVGPPVHVAAFSMGGHAVLHLAQERPEVFSSVALVGVAIADHDGLGAWRSRFDPDRLEAEFPTWAHALEKLHSPLGEDAWRDVLHRDASGELDVEVDLDRLERLDVPVLLVRGDRDPVVVPEQYATLRARWSKSEELVVPNGGHDVQLTRYALVRPALLDFFDRAADV